MEVAAEVIERLRGICVALPEVVEEAAWVGTRWRVRAKTFAHVLAIADGWPPVYARESGTDGPATLLMFRAAGEELDALRHGGPPFFGPIWRADEVGLILDAAPVDWAEVGELVTESYRLQAPSTLRRRL